MRSVDFTREPLVETVVTPKEGYKLLIRPISGNQQEEYSVISVEVVSFGSCFFFRSKEKPKAFLLPMTEYEVIETRETRTVLKKPQMEKPIKIGGGKKVSTKATKTKEQEKQEESEEETPKEEPKKRERKRSRKRRTKSDKDSEPKEESSEDAGKEEKPPVRRTLLPPPTSLISEQIDRYKHYLAEHGALLPEEMEDGSKVEELKLESEEPKKDGSEESLSPTPSFEKEAPVAEDKVVDITEEAHVPSNDGNDS